MIRSDDRRKPFTARQSIARGRLWALVVLLALGCSAMPRPTMDPFWVNLQFGPADEKDQYATIAQLAANSDAIAVGRVTAIEVGRFVQGDAPNDVVAYVQLSFASEHLISGAAPASVPIEFLAGTPENATHIVERARAAGIPSAQIVVFLHAKRGEGEAGIYRVVNSTGLWGATSRSELDSPLRASPPTVSGLYRDELRDIAGVEAFISLVEGLT